MKNLAYNILSIPVSSAAAEREFSVSGWHSLGRKNRTTGVTLAAKVFLTCNKDLLRPLFFKVLFTFLLVFRSFFFLIRTAKYPNEKMPNYLMDLPDNRYV
ncbi:Uncharacterized protein APZ42_000347 [Daphnia magna]|uniref:HAT C-terminal dimerisation domain-containing protein n=1 Tax=Daphnia magna TaxID=35525 RepID=A0A164JQW1_9CRUS|nr:Uncharacterized protein APZ42_000347 [Daphnia magna]